MRMNISIPDDLREEMKPHDERVNWSSVASAAFAREVRRQRELAAINDEVARRLRETEIEDMGGFEEAGAKEGRYWAKRRARMVHLKRLSLAHENVVWTEAEPHDLVAIAFNIRDHSYNWADLTGSYEVPDSIEIQGGWLEGFVRGALEVYDKATTE